MSAQTQAFAVRTPVKLLNDIASKLGYKCDLSDKERDFVEFCTEATRLSERQEAWLLSLWKRESEKKARRDAKVKRYSAIRELARTLLRHRLTPMSADENHNITLASWTPAEIPAFVENQIVTVARRVAWVPFNEDVARIFELLENFPSAGVPE